MKIRPPQPPKLSIALLIVFSETCLLSGRVSDYPYICNGKTRIPGTNDASEFEVTQVRLINTQVLVFGNSCPAFNAM